MLMLTLRRLFLLVSPVDELYIALGCRFTLDIFNIAQQERPSLEPDPLPLEPGLEPWF